MAEQTSLPLTTGDSVGERLCFSSTSSITALGALAKGVFSSQSPQVYESAKQAAGHKLDARSGLHLICTFGRAHQYALLYLLSSYDTRNTPQDSCALSRSAEVPQALYKEVVLGRPDTKACGNANQLAPDTANTQCCGRATLQTSFQA